MEFYEEDMENGGQKFKATVEWMAENYKKANEELFDGMLGECYFEAQPTRPNNLGNFRMNVQSGELAYSKGDRRMFKKLANYNIWNNDKVYINRNNFFEYCKPTIRMNTMYSGTQSSLYNTLVHEMCHYYTYMNGRIPVQAHGVEFREVASYVAYKSGGAISIQRLASAEEMKGYELDSSIKVRTRSHNKPHYYLVFTNNGDDEVRLANVNASGYRSMMKWILNTHPEQTVLQLDNEEIAESLYNNGYRQQSRTYKFWRLHRSDDVVREVLSDDANYTLIHEGE